MSARLEPRDGGGLTMSINSRADLADAIRLSAEVGAVHRIPLLQGLLHGKIAFFEAARRTSGGMVKRFFAAAQKPAVLLLGDDDELPTGPAAWPTAERAMRWSGLVVVHATGGTSAQYAGFVEAARVVRRVLIVETDAAHAAEWVELAKAQHHRPTIRVFLPLPGQTHPLLPKVRQ